MIVVLALLFCFSSTIPGSIASLDASGNARDIHFARATGDGPIQLRSTWDILWTCLCTIFACTWVSVHPNSPGLGETKLRNAIRRLELMIWTVLIPEMIIYWALRQWFGARRIAEFYKDFGWTRTHGHFLQMGGFVLATETQDLEVVTDERFYDLLDKGTMRFPDITRDQIKALSKGDGFSKTIVVGQTSWFIAQCVSRVIQGLHVTEIELATLAFAFLNGFMYFLWWDKPLDAEYLIRIYMSSNPTPISLPAWTVPNVLTTIILSEVEVKSTVMDQSSPDVPSITNAREVGVVPSPEHDPANPFCPLDHIVPEDTTASHTSRRRMREIITFGWRRLSQMRGSNYKVTPNAKRVPTFYAVPHRINMIPYTNLVISVIGVMFGAIHCAGWNLDFPTRAEKIIWRTSAMLISTFPILMIIHSLLIMIGGIPWFLRGVQLKGIVMVGNIFWKCLPIYFLGRMILLTEAFVTLRGLPDEAFLQVEWTKFLPHI